MTTPGVPDLYQGADYWDFSLVDPDNRRPVDFDRRRATFNLDAQPAELMENWQDGRIKQWLIANTLKLRRAHPRLFTEGRYLPLKVEGEHAESVIAFARELDGNCVIVIAARLAYGLLGDSQTPQIPVERWGDTHVRLPDALSGNAMERLFDGMTVRPKQEGLSVPEVLQHLPFALLQLTMSSTGESER
jgi:(1->4)-alpha-D-glucan 1-alpha-D-glucosylmutase